MRFSDSWPSITSIFGISNFRLTAFYPNNIWKNDIFGEMHTKLQLPIPSHLAIVVMQASTIYFHNC